MQKKIEFYVYLHRLESNMLTVSPAANILHTRKIPVTEVEFEVMVSEPRKILLRVTEEQAEFYGFKKAEANQKTAIGGGEGYFIDLVRTIPDQILADEAQRRLNQMQAFDRIGSAREAADTASVERIAKQFAPVYRDESQALHTAHTESGNHTGVDFELHRDMTAPSILDKLPNVSRPITDTLKKIGRSFE